MAAKSVESTDERKLFHALWRGDIDEIRQLLEEGVSPNIRLNDMNVSGQGERTRNWEERRGGEGEMVEKFSRSKCST